MSLSVLAATTSKFGVFELTVDSSEKAEVAVTDTGWTVKLYGKTESGCTGSTNSTVDATLTVTNTGTKADGSVRGVSFTITTTGMKANDTNAAKTLNASENSIQYEATSGNGSSAATTVTIDITNVVQEALGTQIDTIVNPGANGRVFVDGVEITEVTTFTNGDDKMYTLTAEPAEGYEFFGWFAGDVALTTQGETTFTYPGSEAKTLTPRFIKAGSAVYVLKGASPAVYYDFLDQAISAAGGSGTVVVAKTGKAFSSDGGNAFTIPNGVTLLVPYDAGYNVINDNMVDNVYSPHTDRPAKVAFRGLTLTENASLTVQSGGKLNIGGQTHNMMVGHVGPYGYITMDQSSNITVESGGNLFAWGYIFYGTGNGGTVTIKSGAKAYEPLYSMDYTGDAGQCNSRYGEGVFPVRAFAFVNVEVPMTIQHGGSLYTFYHLYGDLVGSHGGNLLFIGSGTDSAFQTVDSTGSWTIGYKDSRQFIRSNGNTAMNPLMLTIKYIMSITMNSGETSGLPIPGYFDVFVESGTVVFNDNLIAMAGSTIKAQQGTTVDMNGKALYVLSAADDPGTGGEATEAGEEDVHGNYPGAITGVNAVMDINGKLIADGGFYTSTGFTADTCPIISSQKTGVIEVGSASTKTSVKIKIGNNGTKDIPIAPASLKHGAGGTLLIREDTFTYNGETDKWTPSGHVIADDAWTVIPATCTTDGSKTGTCTHCGEVVVDVISAPGHNMAAATCTEPATCTAEGCGYTEGEPHGHNWLAPSCTMPSVCTYACGTVIDEPLGHTYDSDEEVRVEPTCTENGYIEQYCMECAYRPVEVLPATGHAPTGEWLTDSENTKHYMTCETCGEPTEEAAHSGGTATCVAVKVCEVCENGYGAVDTVNGHTYGNATYAWADYTACVATHSCTVCPDITEGHTQTANATITNKVAKAATCSAEGERTYTASFDVDWAAEQTKIETIAVDENAHAWTVSYDFAADGKSCTATRACGNNAEHNVTANASITSAVKTPATCTEKGITTYTASFDVDWAETQTKDVADIPALTHSWGEASYSFAEDGKSCTATRTCGRDTSHKETTTATITSAVKTPATCNEKGTTTYTASFDVDWAETQTKDVVDIDALTHSWGEASYSFAEGGTSCTATRTCGRDTSHKETTTATITSAVKTPATCTVMGTTTYTATFSEGWTETQTKDVVDIAIDSDAHRWDNDCDTTCNYDESHTRSITHAYGDWVETTAPTCEKAGEETKTCSVCGDKQTQSVSAKGHSYDAVVTDPTCTADGYTTYTCSVCGDTYKANEVTASGHSYSDKWSSDATNHWHACSVCGEKNGEAAHADGGSNHNCDTCGYEMSKCSFTEKGDVKTVGDCMTETVYKAVCSVCKKVSDTDTVTGEKDSTKHTGNNTTGVNAKAATCTTAGYTGDTVCECGVTVEAGETIPAKNHKYGEASYTWTDDGKNCTAKRICANDASHVEEETVTAVGEITTPATCTVMGITTYTATFGVDWATAQTTTRQDVKLAEHSFNSELGSQKTAATCQAAAIHYVKCDNCSAETTEKTVSVGGVDGANHVNIVDVSAVSATCTSTGLTAGKKCEACGVFTVPQTETEMLEHDLGDWIVDQNATCTINGSQHKKCANCDYEEKGVITAPGHKLSETVVVPTCEDQGYTLHECSECDYEYKDTYTDATEHDYELTDSKDATCTEDGYETYTCKNDASHTYRETIKAADHDYKTLVTAPTCTTGGYTTHTCGLCGHSYVDSNVDATGHSYNESVTKQPTCTEKGEKTFTCHCGDSYTEVIEATGHSHTSEVTTPATCTTAGVMTFTCTCGDTYTEAIETINHANKHAGDAKAATCNAAGNTAGEYCPDCQTWLTEQEVLPAKGHIFIDYTDDEDGKTETAKCENCDAEDTRDAAEDESIVVVEPPKNEESTERVTEEKVIVDGDVLDQLAQTEKKLQLQSQIVELLFDNTALAKIVTSHGSASDISIVVEDKTPEETTDRMVLDIYLERDGKKQDHTDLGDGIVTVSVPLDEFGDLTGKDIEVWYIKDANNKEKVNHQKDAKYIKFDTNHFSEYEIVVVDTATSETVTVTFDNKTKDAASINAPTDGAVGSAYTFTVTSEQGCIVAYTIDNGATYTRLQASGSGTTRSFSVTLTEGMKFVVVVKGDVNGSGDVTTADVGMLNASVLGRLTLNAIQSLSGDANGVGGVTTADVGMLNASILGRITLTW